MSEKPSISAICLTFARPQLLEEAIHSFLIQDYDGPKELIVLNTFLRQRLIGDFPNVRIINAEKRPSSLGACRNLAISQAKHDYIVIWDDDDVFLPWHLRNYAEAFADPNIHWAHQDTQFFSLKGSIKSITPGSMPLFAFSTHAWQKVGGYHPSINVGEDQQIMGRITQSFSGRSIKLPPEAISYVYCWDNGSYHISGMGFDQPGSKSSYARILRDAMLRVASKRLKTGDIKLKPHWLKDYVAQARKFSQHTSASAQTVYPLQLNSTIPQEPSCLIFHAVERHECIGARDLNRKRYALESWATLYRKHKLIPRHYVRYKRDSSSIGDKRRLPFLKDVLKNGMDSAGQQDVVLWTNDDTILHPNICVPLLECIGKFGCASSQRCDFRRLPIPKLSMSPEQWAQSNATIKHPGRDLLAFTKRWLVKHWDAIPDFVLGAPEFDLWFAYYIRMVNGMSFPDRDIDIPLTDYGELPYGYVGHVSHGAVWTQQQGSTANAYNARLRHASLAELRCKKATEQTNTQVLSPNQETSTAPQNKPCIVQLGRFGDIINILPVVRHISDTLIRPTLMVSEEFASLLDGVSYCDTRIVQLNYGKLNEAIEIAKKEFSRVIVTQVWGHNYAQEKQCDTYGEESWRKAGMLHMYNSQTMLPRFDRRNHSREEALIDRFLGSFKSSELPIVLVNLHGGKSSPIENADALFEAIDAAIGENAHVVDMCKIHAERLFDLIGLFENADLLLTIDSSLLHLVAATSLRTFAIINPTKWLGTKPRCNTVAMFNYSQAQDTGLIAESVMNAVNQINTIEAP